MKNLLVFMDLEKMPLKMNVFVNKKQQLLADFFPQLPAKPGVFYNLPLLIIPFMEWFCRQD